MSRSLDLRLGGGFGLAATWDHLGLFFPLLHIRGRLRESRFVSLRQGLLSQNLEEGRARGSPPPARSAARLDQSLRRSSPRQLQHQARAPRGTSAAKSPTRQRAPHAIVCRGCIGLAPWSQADHSKTGSAS